MFKFICLEKRRAFLDLLLEAARQGADLSETDIISQVDTFMFEVRLKLVASTFFLVNLKLTQFRLIGPRHYISCNYLVSLLHGDTSGRTSVYNNYL